MSEKGISGIISGLIGFYVLAIIGNATTGIINDSIDKVVPELDSASASMLLILRFFLNFEGFAVISVVGLIVLFISQVKK